MAHLKCTGQIFGFVKMISLINLQLLTLSLFRFPAEQAAVAGGERTLPGFSEGRDSDRSRRGFLQRRAQLL